MASVFWTVEQLSNAVTAGIAPNGDFLGSTMAEVIEHSTAKLTDEDRGAIASYLLSLK